MQNKHNTILTGCPILLQVWSYERIVIGRPIVDHSPYELDMYGDTEDYSVNVFLFLACSLKCAG